MALGLLLVFRTNASYDRYWEGRKLVGAIANRTRDIARQLRAYVKSDDPAAKEAVAAATRGLDQFYQLTVMSLRLETNLENVKSMTKEERAKLLPLRTRAPAVLAWIAKHFEALAAAGHLRDVHLHLHDTNLGILMDSLGGCERIARTPVPFAYAQHIKWFVTLFCFTVPLVMVDSMSWGTPIATAVLAFALYGIDELGVEIEDPFGEDPNDLPMDAVGENITRSLSDIGAA